MANLPPRALLRSISARASNSPIETIVLTFVLVTLAYFQILHSIKHSDFLSGGISNPLSSLKPTYTRRVGQDWVTASEQSWSDLELNGPIPVVPTTSHRASGVAHPTNRIQLVQVLFSLDDPYKVLRGSRYPAPLPVTSPSVDLDGDARDVEPSTIDTWVIADALQNITRHITHDLKTSQGLTYQSLCYKPSQASPSASTGCFVWTHPTTRTQTITLAFPPSSSGYTKFISALQGLKFGPDVEGSTRHLVSADEVHFEVMGREERIGEMRSGKWVAYAARGLVLRFWELAKVSARPLSFVVFQSSGFLIYMYCAAFIHSKPIQRIYLSSFWAIS